MNRPEAVARLLREAEPHRLLAVLRASLAQYYGTLSADLLLADYGLTVLCHVTDPGEEGAARFSVFDSVVGRVFDSQEPHVERRAVPGVVAVHVPVTVRGDRLGVLSVETEDTGEALDDPRELRWIADILGHALLVAERDTDLYRVLRRSDRLTLAAEMQWDLLPGRAYACDEYSIGAQLEPAYAVHGDNYDWAAGGDRLVLAVTNGMGEGVEAALLTSLAVNALRNARRGGVPLADQIALADKAVYAVHRGERYLDVLLLDFDLATGHVRVVDAGSPRLYVLRGGSVLPSPFEAQLPLGMAEDSVYVTQDFEVEAGDRLVFVSDGVFDSGLPLGEAFGDAALARAILDTAPLPAASVPQEVLRRLSAHQGGGEMFDDALVVCLDWRGRG